MGQNSSRQSVTSSIREKIKPFRKRGHSDLSAAFNLMDVDLSHEQQLNINLATEEELMTLPGINRITARNIIEYRQTIGAFRKVEDLALVSGVGASKLEQIRPEICVSSRRKANTSLTSSLNGSTESLNSSVTSNNRSLKVSNQKVINVNKANVFQLMNIRAIDQESAANIVHYREKKGFFKSIDELIKVKGISVGKLSIVRRHLTVDMNAAPIEYIPHTPQRTPMNNRRTVLHQRSRSAQSKFVSPQLDKSDLYELLASRSQRAINEETFNFRRNGKPALRLATWNLQRFVADKVDNPGVREVICRTILENGFSVIACQELGDKEVLDKICAELTNPCLKKVHEWAGHRGTWECVTSDAVGQLNDLAMEYSGFLYDTSRGVDLIESGLLCPLSDQENGNCPRRSFWASFRVDKAELTIVCINTSAQANKGRRNSLLESLKTEDMLKNLDRLQISKNVIILGDLNRPPTDTEFNPLRDDGYTHVVPVGTFTNSVSGISAEAKHFDNIWISKMILTFFTGHWGMVNQGLTHLAIPNGWTWGGVVSDHCPIWAEFYAQLNTNDNEPSLTTEANGTIKEEIAT